METLKIIFTIAIIVVGFLVYREAVELGETLKQQQKEKIDSLYLK